MVENEARARQVTSYRAHQKRENAAATISGMRGSLEQMMSQFKTSGRKEFPLIVKADVQGSLEAILGSLEKLGTEEVAARILHAGVGGISESDVTLAEGFNAAIIGFTSAPTRRRLRPPSATASRSATTTSSTTSWMT